MLQRTLLCTKRLGGLQRLRHDLQLRTLPDFRRRRRQQQQQQQQLGLLRDSPATTVTAAVGWQQRSDFSTLVYPIGGGSGGSIASTIDNETIRRSKVADSIIVEDVANDNSARHDSDGDNEARIQHLTDGIVNSMQARASWQRSHAQDDQHFRPIPVYFLEHPVIPDLPFVCAKVRELLELKALESLPRSSISSIIIDLAHFAQSLDTFDQPSSSTSTSSASSASVVSRRTSMSKDDVLALSLDLLRYMAPLSQLQPTPDELTSIAYCAAIAGQVDSLHEISGIAVGLKLKAYTHATSLDMHRCYILCSAVNGDVDGIESWYQAIHDNATLVSEAYRGKGARPTHLLTLMGEAVCAAVIRCYAAQPIESAMELVQEIEREITDGSRIPVTSPLVAKALIDADIRLGRSEQAVARLHSCSDAIDFTCLMALRHGILNSSRSAKKSPPTCQPNHTSTPDLVQQLAHIIAGRNRRLWNSFWNSSTALNSIQTPSADILTMLCFGCRMFGDAAAASQLADMVAAYLTGLSPDLDGSVQLGRPPTALISSLDSVIFMLTSDSHANLPLALGLARHHIELSALHSNPSLLRSGILIRVARCLISAHRIDNARALIDHMTSRLPYDMRRRAFTPLRCSRLMQSLSNIDPGMYFDSSSNATLADPDTVVSLLWRVLDHLYSAFDFSVETINPSSVSVSQKPLPLHQTQHLPATGAYPVRQYLSMVYAEAITLASSLDQQYREYVNQSRTQVSAPSDNHGRLVEEIYYDMCIQYPTMRGISLPLVALLGTYKTIGAPDRAVAALRRSITDEQKRNQSAGVIHSSAMSASDIAAAIVQVDKLLQQQTLDVKGQDDSVKGSQYVALAHQSTGSQRKLLKMATTTALTVLSKTRYLSDSELDLTHELIKHVILQLKKKTNSSKQSRRVIADVELLTALASFRSINMRQLAEQIESNDGSALSGSHEMSLSSSNEDGADLNDWRLSNLIWTYQTATRFNIPLDSYFYDTLMNAFARIGDMNGVMEVLGDFIDSNLPLTPTSVSTLMKACIWSKSDLHALWIWRAISRQNNVKELNWMLDNFDSGGDEDGDEGALAKNWQRLFENHAAGPSPHALSLCLRALGSLAHQHHDIVRLAAVGIMRESAGLLSSWTLHERTVVYREYLASLTCTLSPASERSSTEFKAAISALNLQSSFMRTVLDSRTLQRIETELERNGFHPQIARDIVNSILQPSINTHYL